MPDTTYDLHTLGDTDLEVSPLCLGTNTFGWTADEEQAHAILDAYTDAGGNFIDTAVTYPAWAPGNEGGESEAIIGNWIADRRARGRVVLASKVGMAGGKYPKGLTRDHIRRGIEDSLRRLQVDSIDVFYAHEDDADTPQLETLRAFDELVREGMVDYIAASNFTADRLAEALRISDSNGWVRYAVLQPRYNLLDRDGFEGPLQDLCVDEGIAVTPYPALAGGFLTGKYRPGVPAPAGARSQGAQAQLTPRGIAILDALDDVAAAHGATVAQVAVAWVLARPGVVSALASATSTRQVDDLLPAQGLTLTSEQIAALAAASAACPTVTRSGTPPPRRRPGRPHRRRAPPLSARRPARRSRGRRPPR